MAEKTDRKNVNRKASKGFQIIEFRNAAQQIAWSVIEQHDVVFITGPAGTAKANSIDTLVHTPSGPKRMGDISVGDKVCTPDGLTSKVTGVFPQGIKDIYKVSFVDGDSVECCAEHLWKVDSLQNGWNGKVLMTQELMECKTPSGRRKYSIQVPKMANMNERPVLIPAYLMGALLGDGSFRSASLRFSTTDNEIVENVKLLLGENYCVRQLANTSYCDYVIKNSNQGKCNYYISSLKEYGLWKCKSTNKFIPKDYIYNTKENRLALIRGLMDTDGTVDKKTGQAVFCTTSHQLALDFKTLLCSVGGLCSIVEGITYYKYKGVKKKGKVSYKCYIQHNNPSELFSLSRKKNLTRIRTKYYVKRIIDNIEFVGKKEAQCIMIDHPEHLYLVDNFVVTHNTHLAVAYAVTEVLAKRKKRIILTRPVVEAGEKLGFLPGTFEEKINPYLMPIFDCMDSMLNPEARERIDHAMTIAPLAYLRGRTFYDSVCILDEAQNCKEEQVKMFLTRLGDGSKMIITGDPTQTDLQHERPLNMIVDAMKTVHGIGIVEFNEDNIVRHPLVSSILKAWPK